MAKQPSEKAMEFAMKATRNETSALTAHGIALALDAFAAEAVKAEREACAKVAESEPNLEGPPPEVFKHIVLELRAAVAATKDSIAAAIRARRKE